MRSYHDPIEVRRGLVCGQEAPEQFLWRDRLWLVREVIAHWVETGAWWEHQGIADPLADREVWRVEAGRGRERSGGATTGVFDVSFDAADGRWRLVCAVD